MSVAGFAQSWRGFGVGLAFSLYVMIWCCSLRDQVNFLGYIENELQNQERFDFVSSWKLKVWTFSKLPDYFTCVPFPVVILSSSLNVVYQTDAHKCNKPSSTSIFWKTLCTITSWRGWHYQSYNHAMSLKLLDGFYSTLRLIQ